MSRFSFLDTYTAMPIEEVNKNDPYRLADGRYITHELSDELCEAIADDQYKYFFDLEILKLVRVDEYTDVIPEKGCLLPRADQDELRHIAHDSLEFMQPIQGVDEGGTSKTAAAAEMLRKLLEDTSLSVADIYRQMSETYPYELGAWEQGRYDYLGELMEDWLSRSPLDAKRNMDYWFDGECPCCQHMRASVEGWITPTLEGVEQAFDQTRGFGKDD